MTNTQSLYLVVLCVALLGAIVFAYSSFKHLKAQGERIPTEQRLVVKISMVTSSLLLLAACLVLGATLQDETSNWNTFLVSLTRAVTATFMSGTVAWLCANRSSS